MLKLLHISYIILNKKGTRQMNITKMAKIIYPVSFNTQYVYAYRELNDELRDLIETSGYKNEFTRKYRRSLLMLENLKENCTKQKTFEKLTNEKDLYSIRLKGEKNIRILFTFAKLNKSDIVILLYAFQEKDQKNKSKTSYSKAIEIAHERINNLKKS